MDNLPNYEDVMNQIQQYIDNYDDFEQNGPTDGGQHQPTIGELDQFRKDWFYDDWQIRFRELNAFYPLGTKGVVAIPNTTFEEWLYWFQQWAVAFEQDYNKFKKLVFDTINLIEKHLEAIDKTLEDHEKRIEKLEQEVQDIYHQIDEINNKIENLQNQITSNDQKHTDAENHLQQQIDDIGDQLKSNISPHWLDATPQGVGAAVGWKIDESSHPNGFNIQYRWLMNTDHSQGLYLNLNFNHIFNDYYNNTDQLGQNNSRLIMDVDLTDFVNQTHAQIPELQWPATTGSYFTDQQRNGFGYYWEYDQSTHHLRVYLEYLNGVYSVDKWPNKITLINGGTEIFCPVSQ